jgi:hypothetical protein
MRVPLKTASAMFRGLRLPSLVSIQRDGPCTCQTRSQRSLAPPWVVPLFGEHVPCTQDIISWSSPQIISEYEEFVTMLQSNCITSVYVRSCFELPHPLLSLLASAYILLQIHSSHLSALPQCLVSVRDQSISFSHFSGSIFKLTPYFQVQILCFWTLSMACLYLKIVLFIFQNTTFWRLDSVSVVR